MSTEYEKRIMARMDRMTGHLDTRNQEPGEWWTKVVETRNGLIMSMVWCRRGLRVDGILLCAGEDAKVGVSRGAEAEDVIRSAIRWHRAILIEDDSDTSPVAWLNELFRWYPPSRFDIDGGSHE